MERGKKILEEERRGKELRGKREKRENETGEADYMNPVLETSI